MEILAIILIVLVSILASLVANIAIDKINIKNDHGEEKIITNDKVPYEKLQLLISMDNPIEKINTILDNIIDNYIKLYQVQNPSLEGSFQYIKEDEVNNIILPYVYFMTIKSMTPEIIELLSMVYSFKPFNLDEFLSTYTATDYRPSNNDTNTLEWVVFTRVNLAVINFVNKINQ